MGYRHLTQEEKDSIWRMYESGTKPVNIAAKVNRALSTVTDYIAKRVLDDKAVSPAKPGESVPAQTVVKIRDMHESNPRLSYSDIASLTGTTKAQVWEILKQGYKPATPPEPEPKPEPLPQPTKPPTCPKCGKVLPVGSRFCWNCGEKIITPRELAVEGLNQILKNVTLLPVNIRDDAVKTINLTLNILKEDISNAQ